MLVRGTELQRATVMATDGRAGRSRALYFEDRTWIVRYLVVRRGFWIFGSDALVSPLSVPSKIVDGNRISTSLTRKRIHKAPPVRSAVTVSREMEQKLHAYYQIPVYWGGSAFWGGAMTPVEAGVVAYNATPSDRLVATEEPRSHLRSSREVLGYRVFAEGEEIGKAADFLVEDTTWAIRYLVVHADSSLGSRSIPISTDWIDTISWTSEEIDLNIAREEIGQSPAVEDPHAMTRTDEERLHTHYRRPRYWPS